MIPTGYTPPVHKSCTRCTRPVECQLYELCEVCQAIDTMIAQSRILYERLTEAEQTLVNAYLVAADYTDERDRKEETDFARYGY